MIYCSVPWCTELAPRHRKVLARELQGLCRRCDPIVRSQARYWGLAEARRRRDAKERVGAVGLGSCDRCSGEAVLMDLDGGAWCANHAPRVIEPWCHGRAA